MSSESTSQDLTNDDRALLEHIDAGTETSTEDELEQLRTQNRELEEEVQDLRDELDGWKQTMRDLVGTVNELQDKVNGKDPSDPRAKPFYENLTILEKYQRMSEEEREELLSGNPSKQRAVLIFENWDDWAKKVNAGWLISTNHTRGKHGKTAISVDLQTATGEDLQSNEVYRAMKAVAKLSVQDPDDVQTITDDYGREHITGGAFEYHEKVNPDAKGRERKYKILKLVDEEEISLP